MQEMARDGCRIYVAEMREEKRQEKREESGLRFGKPVD
jgi:hypothetical protein